VNSAFRTLAAVALLLTGLCSGNNLRDHVVSVQHIAVRLSPADLSLPHIQYLYGSGICINPECSVIATAYHVQMFVGRAAVSVTGARTDKVLSSAQSTDSGKVIIPADGKTLFLNPSNDMSFIYVKKPVRHKAGVAPSYNSYPGQPVKIVGYYKGEFHSVDSHIIGSNVPIVFNGAQMDDGLIVDIKVTPGSSGSAVLDLRGNLLGMVTLAGDIQLSDGKKVPASVALPTSVLARALIKLDPALGLTLFNGLPAIEPKTDVPLGSFQESDLPDDTSQVVPELDAIPIEGLIDPVSQLRAAADASYRTMTNFVAQQCFVQGKQKPVCSEVAVANRKVTIRFRGKNGDLGDPMSKPPPLKYGTWPVDEWLETLGEIGDNSWIFRGVVGDRYLFTFRSAVADDRCYWEEFPQGLPLFSGRREHWEGPVDCFEQVLTDKNFNVLSTLAEMQPPEPCLAQLVQTALYYDWVQLDDMEAPVLLPVRERIAVKVKGQKELMYTNVLWAEYRKFRVGHKVKF
jgi:hypothetical protein